MGSRWSAGAVSAAGTPTPRIPPDTMSAARAGMEAMRFLWRNDRLVICWIGQSRQRGIPLEEVYRAQVHKPRFLGVILCECLTESRQAVPLPR